MSDPVHEIHPISPAQMDGTKTPAEISAADKLEKATVSADTPDEPKATTVEAGVLERLSAAQAKAAEHYDALLRATAEAENARRRAQEDVARAHKYAIETFAEHLLPVMDSMHAALADSTADLTKVREGVELTLKQLSTAFVKGRIIELNPLGEKFDPHHHQAISMVPSDQEPNTVVAVLQRGYKIADRVLRPALVTVAQVK